MTKYIITITPVLKNEPLPAVVLDVSGADVSINYPKDSGIKVDSIHVQTHSELCVKMPDDDKEFHLWYDNSPANTKAKSKGYELSSVLRKHLIDFKSNLRSIPLFSKTLALKR